MSPKRLSHVRADAMESPLLETPGESIYAIRAPHMHTNKPRSPKWLGAEFGLIAHTTGSQLPADAHLAGLYPTVIAVDRYFKSRGPHYVCGWRGYEGGDLLQVANEHIQSNGVRTTERKRKGKIVQKGQRNSERGEYKGSWEKDLPPSLVKRLKKRWPGMRSPLRLLPASPNICMIQCEMIPCVFWVNGEKRVGAVPMRKGLKFTKAQHDTIAFLAVDIADRKGWPDGWHRTPRLGGHSDYTPISRHNSGGGWDPGGLRAKPFFDWDYVYTVIEDLLD